MLEVAPDPALLRSLGRLVRGLSALFWGLPLALIVCFHSARFDTLKTLGLLPPLVCTSWLLYGVSQLTFFQRQERGWIRALDTSQLLGMVLAGLSPFLYWWGRIPGNSFFAAIVALECLVGVMFLASLNVVLQRLGNLLPDEALRTELRQFTSLNLNLLTGMVLMAVLTFGLTMLPWRLLPGWAMWLRALIERGMLYLLVPLLLLPLAMTMALLWKTKEVVLEGLFTGRQE